MKSEEEAPQASQTTSSLIKRLAGPSTGKAGLAKDQTEINQIIAEASKGSKFYENEKRKDKEVTERISKILKERDEVLAEANLVAAEKSADHLISELETQRDLTRIVVHIDMDAFYANVELLDNPDLAGKPFGVGYGVLTTASYEARKYGVRSGMAGFIAKKLCPDLIFVKNHFHRYSEMSGKVMAILRRYDETMAAASVDEAYLDVTDYCETHMLTAEECVSHMRKAIQDETQLTASAGIAPNKMLAKICSDKNKPNGQFQLQFDNESILKFMYDLPIRKIPGIGRVNERLLESINIQTCGDIYTQRATVYLMDKYFGREYLFRTYLGIASNVVQPGQRHERKSIGAERTFSAISDKGKILAKLEEVAEELAKDMERSQWTGRTVTLKYKLDNYQVFNRAKSLDRWVKKKDELLAIGRELLMPEFPLCIRLIGLRVTKLKDLKAPEPANGLKRFFEAAASKQDAKKQKLRHDTEDDMEEDRVEEAENAMPGFYEDEDASGDPELSVDDDAEISDFVDMPDKLGIDDEPSSKAERRAKPQSRTTKPQSAGKSPRKPLSKPESSSRKIEPSSKIPADAAPGLQTCPICDKSIQVDNNQLNEHIDFCLSRSTTEDASGDPELRTEISDFADMPDKLGIDGELSGKADVRAEPQSRTFKPQSADKSPRKPLSKPSSSSRKIEPPSKIPADAAPELQCPICNKSMQVDNNQFNEHIDFCLSRSTIREAQAEASNRDLPQFFKPRSKGKSKARG